MIIAGRQAALARRRTTPRRARHSVLSLPVAIASIAAPFALVEPFDGTTIDTTLWTPGGSAAVSGGALQLLSTSLPADNWSEILGITFDFTGRAVTVEWDPSVATGVYTELDVYVSTGRLAVVSPLTDGTVLTRMLGEVPYTVYSYTPGDWRWIRVDSDPMDPGTVTLRRSPDAKVWTTLRSITVSPLSLLESVYIYAYADYNP